MREKLHQIFFSLYKISCYIIPIIETNKTKLYGFPQIKHGFIEYDPGYLIEQLDFTFNTVLGVSLFKNA